MNLIFVFFLLCALRLASVFIVQTYYVPDEYWQSLEVAHKIAFGYGYLTWEWLNGLRTYIYPLLIAGVYKLLALAQLDTVQFLTVLPRVLQALLSAYSDYRFFVWSGKKKWALFLITSSWFWFYIGSRTLANTFETSLTTIAMSYYPWKMNVDDTAYLWFAAVCCFMRPTAIIIWIPLVVYQLLESHKSSIRMILTRYLPIGLTVGAAGIAIDSYMYGRFIVTPYEFARYNIFKNIGAFYGQHSFYWYFLVGLPVVLGVNFLPFLVAATETLRNQKTNPVRVKLLVTIAASLLVLSVVEHKEFRFVSTLVPLCLCVTSGTLTRWSYKASTAAIWTVALLIGFFNIIPAWYTGTIHQRGPLTVMENLREVSRAYRSESNQRASILFLMPCHSTPYYSHMHENVTMRFLTCEPNLHGKPHYVDEADQFYKNPSSWLRSHVPIHPRTALPSHVVLYESLAPKINEFLTNYKPYRRIFHSEYLTDERTSTHILIYQRLHEGEENTFNREEWQEKPEQPGTNKPFSRDRVVYEPYEDNLEDVQEATGENLFN